MGPEVKRAGGAFALRRSYALTVHLAGGAPAFSSGDPLDQFVTSFFTNPGGCIGATPIAAGGSCSLVLHYITAMADFNGDSGLNSTGITLLDANNQIVQANIAWDMTIVDPLAARFPDSSPPASALGLLGWRRKRKAQAVA